MVATTDTFETVQPVVCSVATRWRQNGSGIRIDACLSHEHGSLVMKAGAGGDGMSIATRRVRRAGWAAVASGAIGLAARSRGALTRSGVLGAMITGTGISGAGGWDWGAALVYFFVSASALSKVAPAWKTSVAADKFDKGSTRDMAQALANGGAATALALARATSWGEAHATPLADAFAGALATANADTWATEIGTLSQKAPRLITSGRRVAPGTSGGVTPLGLAASAAGAATLGCAFALARLVMQGGAGAQTRTDRDGLATTGAALIGGVAGSVADSILGATVQAMYWCPACGAETERQRHRCGTATTRIRGLTWLTNDGVNAASTLLGAATGAAVGALVRGAARWDSETRASQQLARPCEHVTVL